MNNVCPKCGAMPARSLANVYWQCGSEKLVEGIDQSDRCLIAELKAENANLRKLIVALQDTADANELTRLKLANELAGSEAENARLREDAAVKFAKDFLEKVDKTLMVSTTCPEEYEFVLMIKTTAAEIRNLREAIDERRNSQ